MTKEDAYYQALRARDARFDGKFFVGVKTTGIYCRPICPARPKRENVEFFSSAAAAEAAGYRACLRCRPGAAPQSPAWRGKSAVVQRALRLITTGALFQQKEEAFAARFGVTARHLRRLFQSELGLTPKQISDAYRLDFARSLLEESALPVTRVAHTAGFSSLRRFNDAFKARFHKAPSALRRPGARALPPGTVELSLSYRPPLDWPALLAFFAYHEVKGVDRVHGETYERAFQIGKARGHFTVSAHPQEPRLLLRVTTSDPRALFLVRERVRRMFDLDSDPLLVQEAFRASPLLHTLLQKYPGVRIASGWDPFEASVCTVLGQLVSMAQARRLVAQLVEYYGAKLGPAPWGEAHAFPTPEALSVASLAEVKTTAARRRTIQALSSAVQEKRLDLASPPPGEEIRAQLRALPGIGPWSCEYICLRALADSDAFPGSDLILARALVLHPELDLEAVRPWRAYAAILLWREYAEKLSRPNVKKKEASDALPLPAPKLPRREASARSPRKRARGRALGK